MINIFADYERQWGRERAEQARREEIARRQAEHFSRQARSITIHAIDLETGRKINATLERPQ